MNSSINNPVTLHDKRGPTACLVAPPVPNRLPCGRRRIKATLTGVVFAPLLLVALLVVCAVPVLAQEKHAILKVLSTRDVALNG